MTKRPIYLVSNTPAHDESVIHLPLLVTRWLYPAIDLSRCDGIIFTSKNGVDAMERIDTAWKKLPALCVGSATRKRVMELGGEVTGTAGGYGDELYALVKAYHADKRWCYARPKVVASDFAQRLRREGIALEEHVVYETVCRAETVSATVPDDAVLIFTSPSALHCFLSRFSLLDSHEIVVIGRTTRDALPGRRVHVASEPTVAACIALAKQLQKEAP